MASLSLHLISDSTAIVWEKLIVPKLRRPLEQVENSCEKFVTESR